MTGMTVYNSIPTLWYDPRYSDCPFRGVTADISGVCSIGTILCTNHCVHFWPGASSYVASPCIASIDSSWWEVHIDCPGYYYKLKCANSKSIVLYNYIVQ